MLQHNIIIHSHIARCLVGHMHIVAVFNESVEGATHRDYIVIGVRREDNNPLGEGGGAHGACAIVGIGFTAGPSCDGVLQIVEHINVNLVIGALLLEQFAQRILQIVIISELQDRLTNLLTEPYNSLAHKFWGPLARTDQPRGLAASEHRSGVLVNIHSNIIVLLKQRCGHITTALALDNLFHGPSLILSPCHQHYLLG